MKKNRYLIVCLLCSLLMIQACTKLFYPVYPIPEYTGSISWELINKKADWYGRWDHSAVSFQQKIWIFGGYNPGQVKGDSYLEDVWSSADGISWDLVTDKAPWLGRRGHSSIVFNDGSGQAIYLIGGYSVNDESGIRQYNNDVWKSSDGISWVEIKTNSHPNSDSRVDWAPRFNHRCEVLDLEGKTYIYLLAGAVIEQDKPGYLGMKYFSDVWRTGDGVNWEKLNNNDFGHRSEHATTVDNNNGIIYMQGGTYGIHDGENTHLDKPVYQWQELWSSTDGIHWEADNDEQGFPQAYLYRTQHQLVHFKGDLWGFPGKSSSSIHFSKNPDTYAIWKVDKEGNWIVDSEGPPFMPMYGYTLTIHNNKIFILGGNRTDFGPGSQVWSGTL